MREILFRGKKADDLHQWVYGYLLPNNRIQEDGINIFTIIPETIGQYTGLEDKNGIKIFEGDLVKHDFDNKPFEVYFKESRCGYSPFANDGGCGCCCEYDYKLVDDIEVIGNIHDRKV